MSTGHIRAVEGGKPEDYHGFGKDVEQVAELIRLWCTRDDRWMSPKYVIGESYGTFARPPRSPSGSRRATRWTSTGSC